MICEQYSAHSHFPMFLIINDNLLYSDLSPCTASFLSSVLESLFGLTGSFIVVNADPLQLEVWVTYVVSSGIDAMFIADHLPEL